MQSKSKLVNSNSTWNAKRRYKINAVVTINGVTYQNTTGANSNPIDGIDWFISETIGYGGGVSIQTKTKNEIDMLISTSELSVGTTYKIIGVNPTLYNDGTTSGTTIYLQALTINTLSKQGYGEFYNPKYNKAIDGFGVWSNRSTWTAILTTGVFTANELITANNGATGQLFTTLDANIFIALTGDWGTATSITGNVSGATATIATVVLKTYAIGSKAIWGGYSWTNISGLVGEKLDILNLDVEWTKDVYSLTNYNKVLDIIEYDYTNNWISRRYEIEGDNDVIFTKEDSNLFIDDIGFNYSAISVFMFGNVFDYSLGKGLKNNKVENSYFESVDFYGIYISYNTLIGNSSIYSNTLIGNSSISFNTLVGSSIIYNTLASSSINYNTLASSSIGFNTLTGNSSIIYNTLVGSSIIYNTLANSSIDFNTLTGNSSIIYNTLVGSSIIYNTLANSSINIGLIYPLSFKNLQYNTLEKAIINIDITAGTILFSTYPKTVYSRPDGMVKIRYYNNSDVLVIGDITN